MIRWGFRRLFLLIPTFVVITGIAFTLLKLAPGETTGVLGLTGDGISPQSIAQWESLRGIDDPIWIQYGRWIHRTVTFDFGTSLVSERPIRTMIVEALPKTLLLTGSALVVAYLFGILGALLLTRNRGRPWVVWVERLLFSVYALPNYWVALVLVVLFAGGDFFQFFPLRGLGPSLKESGSLTEFFLQTGWHLCLPVLALSYPLCIIIMRYLRNNLVEVLEQDFVLVARSKGLSPNKVLLGHVFPNACLPIVVLFSLELPWLVGGSVLIERIFSIQGMGTLTLNALMSRDYPLLMGAVALVSIVTIVGLVVGDLLGAWIDPRIRDEGGVAK